jgi:predicted ATP-grasp superfamily ATP-dependent carboligase
MSPDPFADEVAYVSALAQIVAKRNIAVIMPAHEDALAIQHHRHLIPPHVRVAAPGSAALELALDKWQLLSAAEAIGIPIPKTIAPESVEAANVAFAEVGFPLVIKPRHGNSGKGVTIASDVAVASEAYRTLVGQLPLGSKEFPIVQSCVVGELVGSAFLADSGRVVSCFTEKYTRCKRAGFGTSVLREPYDNEELRLLTARLVAGLGWDGVGHLDFIVEPDGAPLLIEMNPRFWGALQMSVLNGYDFALALFEQTVFGHVTSGCFTPHRKPTPCLWIAGELIACVEELRQNRWAAPMQSLFRILSPHVFGRYDDFRWSDPFPFLAELCYYGAGFIQSGGDTNPVHPGMLR